MPRLVVLVLLILPLFPRSALAEDAGATEGEAAHDTETSPTEASGGEASQWTKFRTSLVAALWPWSVPQALFDDPCMGTFAQYPYADGPGYLRARSDGEACQKDGAAAHRRLAAQLDVEGGYLNGHVLPLTAGFNLQLPKRTELSLRASLLHDVSEAKVARATQAGALFSWRFVQRPRAQLRAGVGVRFLQRDDPRWGVDVLLYGLDLFPGRRLVARMELHTGTLDMATFIQPRATLGVMVGRVEFYVGGDFMAAYRENTATTRLAGAVAGARMWL